MDNKKTLEAVMLPILAFKSEILDAVSNNSVVVITAQTGAGKSTQVPQFLLEAGYNLVVTQPRRLAARSVAARVAEELGEELGKTIGYRTAVDRQDSGETKCLFCTDGLALVRELMGQNKGVLVLDEVHEWNENIEVLAAWTKCQIEAGIDFKVVLMSATMEAEKLSAFYNGAPIISVPGRLFPVETKEACGRLVDDVAKLVREGRNVLVFQPGKQEITDTISALEQMSVSAEILPLHGELTPTEQAKVFKHYGRSKVVVSTNVAQTSVTIDDIDAVVDSGMERRIELVDGVEGLYLKPISLADATQRKGRAGRTKAGLYIDHCPHSTRPDFPIAEILRKRLDQTVLRLEIAGFDMEQLEFFHQPAKSEIHDAKRALVSLGCMTADGQVTKMGRLINRLPVSVQYGRMLVEADRLGVVDDVITITAILEQKGITVPTPSRNQPDRPDWRRMVPEEKESDVMGQLAVWQMAEKMNKEAMKEKGISLRSFFRVKDDIRPNIAQAVRQFFHFGSTGNRDDILKAVCAGMVDHLFKGSYGSYQNGDGADREIGSSSLVRSTDWLVGKPFDLEIKTRRGGSITKKLIELASKVDPTWLSDVAPQLVNIEEGLNPRFDADKDVCVSITRTHFNGQQIKEELVATPDHEKANEVFVDWLAGRMSGSWPITGILETVVSANIALQQRAADLNMRNGSEIFDIMSVSQWKEWITSRLAGARCVAKIANLDVLKLPELDAELVELVIADSPDTIEIEGTILKIEYGKDWSTAFARTNIEDSFARSLNVETIVLPGGRTVDLKCNGYSAKTVKELVAKLEASRISQAWSEKRTQKEHSSWISSPESVLPLVGPVLSAVEITKTSNGQGEPIYGFLSLYSDSDPDFQIRLRESKEEAEKETEIGIKRLLQKSCREIVAIPREMPWYDCGTTDLGRALESRFTQLITEHTIDLTPSNIKEKIEAVKAAVANIKIEIGGEHEATTKLVDETATLVNSNIYAIDDQYLVESEIDQAKTLIQNAKDALKSASYEKAKRACDEALKVVDPLQGLYTTRSQKKFAAIDLQNEVENEMYNLKNGSGQFVDASHEERMEAHELSNEISRAFSNRQYDDVIEKVKDAHKMIARVSSEMPARRIARRVRFPEAVWEAVYDNEQDAQHAVELAKTVERIVGTKRAIDALENEFHAPYGRSRRQNGLSYAVVSLDQTDVGQSFLGLSRASDVDAWLAGAIAWLTSNQTKPVNAAAVSATTILSQSEASTPSTGSFTDAGDRHFKCECENFTRMTKSEWKEYQGGTQLDIQCSTCGTKGIVQKV